MQCPTNSSAKPSTILTNTTVSSWTSDTTYAGYSYRGDITHSGITSDTSATVVFGNTEASSGNYAPFAVTSTGKISVYSKVNTSITIPTIRVDFTLSYTALDNSPTEGSTMPVTSGGVWNALKYKSMFICAYDRATTTFTYNNNTVQVCKFNTPGGNYTTDCFEYDSTDGGIIIKMAGYYRVDFQCYGNMDSGGGRVEIAYGKGSVTESEYVQMYCASSDNITLHLIDYLNLRVLTDPIKIYPEGWASSGHTFTVKGPTLFMITKMS